MDAKPLTEYPVGSTVTVSEICGGCCARSRMLALGLTPGCCVEILSGDCGPKRLRVRGCELVMGQGECEKILAFDGDQNAHRHHGGHCWRFCHQLNKAG